MSAIYMAAWHVSLDEAPDLYHFAANTNWGADLAALGFSNEAATGYVYPPLWAYLLSPVAGSMSAISFFDLTRCFLTASFAGSVLLAWRFMQPKNISLAAFTLISLTIAEFTMPVQLGLILNQPQMLIILLVILAFERYSAGFFVIAGGLLGLAAALKIIPIFLVLIFILDRNWRAVGACFGTAAALAGTSLVIGGPELHVQFLDRLSRLNDLILIEGANTSFEVFLHQIFYPAHARLHVGSTVREAVNVLWISAVNYFALFGSLAAATISTQALAQNERIRVRLFLFLLAITFFSPLAWIHYFALPLLLAPGLRSVFTLNQTIWVAALMATFFSLPVVDLQVFAPSGLGMTQMVVSPAIITVFVLTVWFSIKTSRGVAISFSTAEAAQFKSQTSQIGTAAIGETVQQEIRY